MSLKWQQFELNKEAVDLISGQVQEYCDLIGTGNAEKQRLRLATEELLLHILVQKRGDIFSDPYYDPVDDAKGSHIINVGLGSVFGTHRLVIRCKGKRMDHMQYDGDDYESFIMKSLGLSPVWKYSGGTNSVSLILKERVRLSMTFTVILSVALSLAAGLIGNALPESLLLSIDSILLTPVVNSFLGLLNTFAGVLILFAVLNGMIGLGNSSTLRKTIAYLMMRIVSVCTFAAAFTAVISVLTIRPAYSNEAGMGTAQFISISQMLFAILPSDPLSPFINGNTLQIISIALFAGGAVISIGDGAGRIRSLIEDGTQLFSKIMSVICRLVPLYIFAALLRQLWFSDAKELLSVVLPIIVFIGICIVLMIIFLFFTAFSIKCPPELLAKKILPPFITAFTTASSIASFQISMDSSKEKLGIDPSFVDFAFPIGSVMYMPFAATAFTVMVVFFAKYYDMTINIAWLVAAVIISSLLAIAVPPVPGAGLMLFSTLFGQLGIPMEALLIASLLNVVFDYFLTGGNIGSLLLELTYEANKLKIIDREKLLYDFKEI